MENQNQTPHKRRVRYKGKYPKKFEEKYKELQPEKYKDTIEHVIQKGNTPAGMHISIMVKEILDFLNIRSLHAAVFGLPVVIGGFRDSGLATDIFNSSSGFNRLNHGDDLMLSKTGFTHSALLRWQIDYAG